MSSPIRPLSCASIFILLALPFLGGCTRKDPAADQAVVEIVARGMTFDAPATIPSGWNTIRLRNESDMVHFALLERMPEGYGIKEQQEQIAPLFQEGMNLLNAGREEQAMKKFAEIPEWFGQIEFLGGPGLVGGGRTAETKVFLPPGTYLIECYIKSNGIFHSYNPAPNAFGMVRTLIVTENPSSMREPVTPTRVTVSSSRGIEISGSLAPGRNTVAVHFADQKLHENFVGHDLHVARLSPTSDLAALERWMDWRRREGLETPAPATFIGGTNEMPAGSTAYLTLDLEPGRYAWIAEVPDAGKKGMMREFVVEPAR